MKVMHSDILFAESRKNYTRLVLDGGSSVMMRGTFSDIASQLNPEEFPRVHRLLVAQRKVTMALPEALLLGQHRVPMSKSYRDAVLQILGIKGKF